MCCPYLSFSPSPNLLSGNGVVNHHGASKDLHFFVFHIQLEGRLLLHETAAGGASTTELGNQRVTLWTREHSLGDCSMRQGCQISLPFTINLPSTFSDEHGTYVSRTGVMWRNFRARADVCDLAITSVL